MVKQIIMTDDEYRKKMQSDHKFPCVWCSHNVIRPDMPLVGVCKVCYVKERKKGKDWTRGKWQTWREFFERGEIKMIEASKTINE